MAYPPGTVFAGFVLQRVLGAGGMGTVYLARHPRLPRYSALKLLSPELSHDPDFRRRFEQEAELAARLNHPNVVSVHDRGIDWDQLWIDMQYIEGVDCAEALARSGPMPVYRALRIVTEVGKGLDYAHRLGLLHRDVKPGNILLAPTHDPEDPERVLLTDFGVAKAVDTANRLTSTGSVVATLAYAAPEQIQAGPLDHRVDVYALGCVVYELLTGQVPFPGGTAYEIMGHHLTKAPPRPTDLVPGLPRGFDDVVATALAKNREDRYGSCRELSNAAWRAVRAVPTDPSRGVAPAPPPTSAPPPVFAPPPPNHQQPWPPVAPAGWQPPYAAAAPPSAPPVRPPPASRAPVAPVPLVWPSPPATRDGRRRGRLRRAVRRTAATIVLLVSAVATLVVPGDGRQVGDAATALALPTAEPLPDTHAVVVFDMRGNVDLYAINVARKSLTARLTSADGLDRAPALSPDRQTVAYLSGENDNLTLRVVAVDGSGDRPLFATPPPGCPQQGRPSWNPADATELVVVCGTGDQRSLRIIGINGELRQVVDSFGLSPIDPSFTPDGTRILYSADPAGSAGGGSIFSVDVDGRSEPVQLTDSPPQADSGPVISPTTQEIVFRRLLAGTDGGNPEIFLMNADGSNQRVVAPNPARDSGAAWSPDGTRILFMSERLSTDSGRTNHLWIVSVDGTGLSQLMRNPGGRFGYSSSWASR